MKLKSHIEALCFTLAVLGACTIFINADYYKSMGLKESHEKVGLYLCNSLILIALAQAFYIFYKKLNQNNRVIDYFNKNNFFVASTCDEEDIDYIIKNSSSLSDNSADDEDTRWIYDQDPSSFTVVKDKSYKRRGYYCLIRLTKAGVTAVKEDKISMRDLSSVFIEKRKYKHVPIYIGGVYGEEKSGVLNAYLISGINEYIKTHKNRAVYARAESTKGLYWLNHYGFKPLNDSKTGLGCLYVLHPKHKPI